MAGELVCPTCHASHTSDERFCPRCRMPLVLADRAAPRDSERRDRARKISPQYAEGELVKVGWARNQPEAELIAGMLLEEGIPSVVRRAGGFDVPDFLAGGPRDILVAASGAEAARDLLLATDAAHAATVTVTGPPGAAARPHEPRPAWVRTLATLLVVITLGLVLGGVVTALIR